MTIEKQLVLNYLDTWVVIKYICNPTNGIIKDIYGHYITKYIIIQYTHTHPIEFSVRNINFCR